MTLPRTACSPLSPRTHARTHARARSVLVLKGRVHSRKSIMTPSPLPPPLGPWLGPPPRPPCLWPCLWPCRPALPPGPWLCLSRCRRCSRLCLLVQLLRERWVSAGRIRGIRGPRGIRGLQVYYGGRIWGGQTIHETARVGAICDRRANERGRGTMRGPGGRSGIKGVA